MFAYDAEDHAAEWWNDWGLLEERSKSQIQTLENTIPTLQIEYDQVVPATDSNL